MGEKTTKKWIESKREAIEFLPCNIPDEHLDVLATEACCLVDYCLGTRFNLMELLRKAPKIYRIVLAIQSELEEDDEPIDYDDSVEMFLNVGNYTANLLTEFVNRNNDFFKISPADLHNVLANKRGAFATTKMTFDCKEKLVDFAKNWKKPETACSNEDAQ